MFKGQVIFMMNQFCHDKLDTDPKHGLVLYNLTEPGEERRNPAGS